MVLDLIAQLDRESTERSKLEAMLRELLDAKRNRKSEQLSEEQLALFAAAWKARNPEAEQTEAPRCKDDDDAAKTGGGGQQEGQKKSTGRQPLARHLKRERIVHDLAEQDKHCNCCGRDLRRIGEDTSERYEYIPASMVVVEDVCLKYACECTIRVAGKPPQPIEKSIAGASLLAQVIVAKHADHLPLHRQERIFERHGVEISRKTMGGWMGQSGDLLKPLYDAAKGFLFESKVIGTDDTGVKVLDPKLDYARTGRIWPYCGDRNHPVIVYDYTTTREGAGPANFLKGYVGYLQADAYGGYDALFKDPSRGLVEVCCWSHARRHILNALELDKDRLGPVLWMISQLYKVEGKARGLSAAERQAMRHLESRPVLDKLHTYLLEIELELLPKSEPAKAVRYVLKNWVGLNRYCGDGDLEIDNNATERSIRGVAVGRSNWTFFGSDGGGKTAAILRTFVATCERVGAEPFAWFRDVLSRIASHPVTRLAELLPHNWLAAQSQV